jgi:hypothetical protein
VVKESELDIIVYYLARDKEKGGIGTIPILDSCTSASLTCVSHKDTCITSEFARLFAESTCSDAGIGWLPVNKHEPWRSVGHFVLGKFVDPPIEQSDDDVASIPMLVGVSHDDYGGEDSGGEDDGVEYQEEEEEEVEAGENKPLFRRGLRLWPNLLDMEDEEPLFVMELTTEETERVRRFPTGNGECYEANTASI